MTPVSKLALIAALNTVVALAMPFSARAEAPVFTSWGTIAEPGYPAKVCTTLKAAITSQNGSVDFYDADGAHTQPDHERIQQAIDGCHDGAVKLVTGAKGEDGFLTGPFELKSGVTLWVDKNVTLFADRDPKDYENGVGTCGTADKTTKKSCRSLIEGHDLKNAGLAGDGKIDGRGGSLLLSGPNKGTKSWWDLAWMTKQGLVQHVFRLMQLDGGENLTLYKLTFENSPNFHLVPNGFTGITAWNIKIVTPSLVYTKPGYACPDGTTPDKTIDKSLAATCFTPDTVKNTDGFDPGDSSHVLLAYSWISDGDDDVAIKAGGKVVSHDQVYAHNHFYFGHGMSLGSETNAGAEHFLITDLIMDGMDSPEGNGLRIKSDAARGGKVRDFVFEHVCMRNEAHPMVFDTHYSDRTGDLYPDFQDITVRDFHYFAGGKYGTGVSTFRGYEENGQKLPLQVSLDTIVFEGGQPGFSMTHGKADSHPFATHFTLAGKNSFTGLIQPSPADDVTVDSAESRASAPVRDCTGVFVPLKSILADSPI